MEPQTWLMQKSNPSGEAVNNLCSSSTKVVSALSKMQRIDDLETLLTFKTLRCRNPYHYKQASQSS